MKYLIIAAALLSAGCTDGAAAKRALEAQGFTEIEITGIALLSCDERDSFRTGFKAKSITGVHATGAVCSGFLKGNTIRLD